MIEKDVFIFDNVVHMYDYSDDLSNYMGNGWPTEEDCFYGNQENLQEKVL